VRCKKNKPWAPDAYQLINRIAKKYRNWLEFSLQARYIHCVRGYLIIRSNCNSDVLPRQTACIGKNEKLNRTPVKIKLCVCISIPTKSYENFETRFFDIPVEGRVHSCFSPSSTIYTFFVRISELARSNPVSLHLKFKWISKVIISHVLLSALL